MKVPTKRCGNQSTINVGHVEDIHTMTVSYRATGHKNLLNLSRSRSRDQWRRRQVRLQPTVCAKMGQQRRRHLVRRWRTYRVGRWLQVLLWLVATAPAWTAGWNMMLATEEAPLTGDYINTPSPQVGEARTTELREMEEEHSDLPDPDEPTTDSDWSNMVWLTPETPSDAQSTPVTETRV